MLPGVVGTATGWLTVTGKAPMVSTMVNIDTLKLLGLSRSMTPLSTSCWVSSTVSGRDVASAMMIDAGSTWVTRIGLAEAVHAPVALRDPGTGAAEPAASLAGREVDLFSAIGAPAAFERTVTGLGARVRDHRTRPDHHAWTAAALSGLGAGGVPVVTTAKDEPKCAELARSGAAPAFSVLDVELRLVRGEALLDALLDALPHGEAALRRQAFHEGLHG